MPSMVKVDVKGTRLRRPWAQICNGDGPKVRHRYSKNLFGKPRL